MLHNVEGYCTFYLTLFQDWLQQPGLICGSYTLADCCMHMQELHAAGNTDFAPHPLQ